MVYHTPGLLIAMEGWDLRRKGGGGVNKWLAPLQAHVVK